MDFYNNVIYEYVINARWFTWTIVLFIFGSNIIMPVFIWFFLSGRRFKMPRSLPMMDEKLTKPEQ